MAYNADITPAELNNLTDDTLKAHVDLVLSALNDGRDPDAAGVSRVAKFVTADVLLRFHNIVAKARNAGDKCGGWPKQATLAKVVACFTGVRMKRSDAEYVGNAQDSYLRQYRLELSKARNTDSQEVSRARKKGREVQPMRSAQVMQRIFSCKFGGVPRIADLRDRMPLHKLPVPIRNLLPVEEINLHLQEQIIKLQQEKDECKRVEQENMSVLCMAVEHERVAREHAEQRASVAVAAHELEAAKAAARVQDLKAQVRDAGRECQRTLGQLARLQYQVGVAHIEVARARDREEQMAVQAERARAEGVEKAAAEVKRLKEMLKDAKKESKLAEG